MKLTEKEIMYILHEAKMLLTEDQESDSIKKAIALYMDRMGCDKKTAEKYVRVDLRSDLPNLRYKKPGKFILGVTRMFLDGQLKQGETIEALNTTITYVASDAHYNEYDKNLNGLSARELINRFADAVKADAEADKERLSQQNFVNSDNYEIVRVDTFEDTSKYNQYCYPNDQWCITKYPSMLDSYTNDGIGQFYFCLRKGFENMEPIQGEGCPKDEYGLSMIAVCVDGKGRLKNSTCRWNHSNGGNDKLFTTDEISHLIGRNFYDVFKPNNKLEKKLDELKQRLKNGDDIYDIFNSINYINDEFAIVYLSGFGWNIFQCKTKEILSSEWFEYVEKKIKNGFIKVELNGDLIFFDLQSKKLYKTQDALQIIGNKIEQLLQSGVDVFDLANKIEFDKFYKSIVHDNVEVSCLGYANMIENNHLKFKKWYFTLDVVSIYNDKLKDNKYYRVCDDSHSKYRIINENEENVLGTEHKWIGTVISSYGTIKIGDSDGQVNIISINDPKRKLCKRSFKKSIDIAFVRKDKGYVFLGKDDDNGYVFCDAYGKDLMGMYFDDVNLYCGSKVAYCTKDSKTAILYTDDLTLTDWYDNVECKYITEYSPSTRVYKNNKVTLLNCITKQLSPNWLDEIYISYRSVYIVRLGELFNLIDETSGSLLSKQWFTNITFSENSSCCCIVTNQDNKQNILKYRYSNPLECKFILENWYDKVDYLRGGKVMIEDNGEQHIFSMNY